MFARRWLQFDDISTPLELRSGLELPGIMADTLQSWCFCEIEEPPMGGKAPIVIEQDGGFYTLSSRWLGKPERRDDPVNIVCALVIELIWAYLEDHPDKLCLHGAAAEFAGRLVVFPNRYRAGKSLLCGCLANAGLRIFTDDILPVEVAKDGTICGVSTGVPPRLRLPLPDNLSCAAKTFLTEQAGSQSAHYRYLRLGEGLQASRSERLPIGGLVFLERQDEGQTELETVSEADMLREVVWQNFARQRPSGSILNTLQTLVAGVPRYRLQYSRAEDAVDLLKAHFAKWPDAAPRLTDACGAVRQVNVGAAPEKAGAYQQSAGVFEHAAGDEHFLADSRGVAIHHLNQTAAMVWRLLAEPMTRREVVELFQAAFPDQPAEQVAKDVGFLLTELKGKGLLRYTAVSEQEPVAVQEARA